MVAGYANALFLAILLSLVMFGVGYVVATISVRLVEKPGRIEGLRDLLTRRAKLEAAFEARREARETQQRELEREIAGWTKKRQTLARKIGTLKTTADRIIRVIGDESTDRTRYHAQISNRYVSAMGSKEQKHALIDGAWAVAQFVEVWATSMGEARSLVDKRYPPSFGFVVHNLSAAAVDRDEVG